MEFLHFLSAMRCGPRSRSLASLTLTLAFLSAPELRADVVQYLVVVDEIATPGHAFYFGTGRSHRNQKDCVKNPSGGAGTQCTLNYTLADGVPTLTSPSAVGGKINSGEYVLLESSPEFRNDARSDVIVFPNSGTDKQGNDLGATSLQFYSQPDDTETDGSTDLKLPARTGSSIPCLEIDLSTIEMPTLSGTSGVSLNLNLAGMFGCYVTADQTAPGGMPGGGKIGYLFISDGDATKITLPNGGGSGGGGAGGGIPEPNMVVPLSGALVGLYFWEKSRRVNGRSNRSQLPSS